MKRFLVVISVCFCTIGFSQKTYEVKFLEGINIDGDLYDWESYLNKCNRFIWFQ